MYNFVRSTALLLVLLNPFLVTVYLVDLIQNLQRKQFTRVLIRAGLIATVVDRQEGGMEALAARGYRLEAVFTREELLA